MIEENQVQALVRRELGLRVGPEMAAHLLRQAGQPDGDAVAVIGSDARTGVPVQTGLARAALVRLLAGLAS